MELKECQGCRRLYPHDGYYCRVYECTHPKVARLGFQRIEEIKNCNQKETYEQRKQ